MVRRDEQRGRLGERCVFSEDPRIYVPVRTDEREMSRFIVDLASGAADGRVGIEVSILAEDERRE